MSINNLPDDCLIEILTKCYDPQAIAPLNKRINRLINSSDFASSLYLSLFEGLNREERAFVYSLLPKDPASQRVKEIFLKTVEVHRSCWKPGETVLGQWGIYKYVQGYDSIHEGLQPFSTRRLRAMLFDIQACDETRCLNALVNFESYEEERLYHQANLSEKRAILFNLIFKSVDRGEADPGNFQKLPLPVTGIRFLPSFIPEIFSGLRRLELDANQLTSLPETITILTNLTELTLNNNQLSRLPERVTALMNLITLGLASNQLTSLPETITILTDLKRLNLGSNQLSGLPEPVAALTNLTTLLLNDNHLTNLPKQITALTNLITLGLASNQLTNLPEPVTALTNLRALSLSRNHVSNLSEMIAALTNLSHLCLRHNQLSNLPEAITALTNLSHLDLKGNKLSKLPEQIIALTNLVILNLDSNQLESLPETITALRSLKNLTLQSNPLISLPRVILQKDMSTNFSVHFVYSDPDFPITEAINVYHERLSENSQEQVHFWNWYLAGKPETSDPDWGNTHLLDDLERFQEALKAQLSTILDSLPHETKDLIYERIYHKSSHNLDRPADLYDPDPNWGYNHRFDDLVFLANRIRDILNQERI